MNEYPKTLADALAMFHKKPTGNVDWDQAVLASCRNKEKSSSTWLELHDVALKVHHDIEKARLSSLIYKTRAHTKHMLNCCSI